MRYFFVFISLIVSSHFLSAQSSNIIKRFGNLLPIKVDNKWGFIDMEGNVAIEPKYDLLGKPFRNGGSFIVANGNYLVVMNEDKVGLINQNGTEVLTPLFDEIIRIQSDSVFTVKNEGEIFVVNNSGKTLLEGTFEDIFPLNDNYFIVKNNNLWGLTHKEKGDLIPPQYQSLKQLKKGKKYLKFSNNTSSKEELIGLIDFENHQIFPPNFNAISFVNDNYFLTKKDFFQLWDISGKKLLKDNYWKKAKVISKSFIEFDTDFSKPKLFSIAENRFIDLERDYDDIQSYNREYLVGIFRGKKALIDKNGKEIIPPLFEEIISYASNIYKVKDVQWGLYQLQKGLILPTKYDAIDDIKGNFAIISKKLNHGLIDSVGNVLLQTNFSEIQLEENNVKAFQGKRMSYYKVETDLSLILIDVYPEVYTLRVGYDIDTKMGSVNPFGARRFGNSRRLLKNRRKKKTPDYSQIDSSDWEWFNEWGKWGLRQKSTDQITKQPQYENVIKLPFTDLSMVYDVNIKIEENQMLQMMTTNSKRGGYGMALFSHSQGKFLNDFDLMGIRVEDFEYDYPTAAGMNKDGKFILINKKGKILKNKKQYVYVGEYSDGLAKVCSSGHLKNFRVPKEEAYKFESSSTIKHNFKVSHDRFITAPSSDIFIYDGAWGFIDTFGNEVIKANYDFVHDFLDGNAICKKEKWGAINPQNQTILDFEYKGISKVTDFLKIGVGNRKPAFYNNKGNTIIDWGYERFTNFSEGFCAVRKKGKWGYVNKEGKEIIACEYLSANPFNNGLAAVQDKNGWFFIDDKEEVILDLRNKPYKEIGNFSEGLCWFKVGKGDKNLYGYFNKKGEEVIQRKYTKAFDFEYGRARVAFNKKTGLIDTQGNFVMFPKKYDLVFPFNEYGIAKVQEDNMGEFGLINLNGKELAPCKYLKINDFDEGVAKMVVTRKGIGFLDTLGNEVIPPIYRSVGEFSEGLVTVQNEHSYQWQYVDSNNKLAFDGEFSVASPFQNGVAIVRKIMDVDLTNYIINRQGKRLESNTPDMIIHVSEGKIGNQHFIKNAEGEIISTFCYFTTEDGEEIHPNISYKSIEPFKNNISIVQNKDRKWGIINHKGFQVIPNKFNKIFPLGDEIYSGIAVQLYGLSDRAGNIILEPVYDDVIVINSSLLRIEQGSKIGYFNQDGDWLWQMQN